MNDERFAATVERFTGFGAHYDAVRPSPPAALGELLTRVAACPVPQLVVDLGSGSGLSTRYWESRARAVIGIEPTDAMREQAERRGGENVSYRKGFSHATGLTAATADLVVCGQSLHWMEPAGTFAEAVRLLRPGGLFAAYDYDWPPVTGAWPVDQAYFDAMQHSRQLEWEMGLTENLAQWEKSGHLQRMEESGLFRHVRECVLHHEDRGGAARIVGLLLSQGHVQSLLKRGVPEAELGIDHLRAVAGEHLGAADKPWLWSTRVRLAVK